jgi:dTDP-glucose pyrophosphorylase
MHRNRTIGVSATLLNALKKMDELGKKLLIVLDSEQFAGLLSIGDIQRAIIQEQPLDVHIKNVLRKDIRIAKPGDSFDSIKQMMFEFRMELCPVVNDINEIVDVYFWEDLFHEESPQPREIFNIPVVIMAGGYGTRLKPLTDILPKALLPIGNKTILEEIVDRFVYHGCNHFFISSNYKSDFIAFYLNSLNLPYTIELLNEEKPLGTVGSLSLLKGKINRTFFISNCDIIIDQDYSEILHYHRNSENDITIVAVLKHYPIPYGIIDTGENGRLVEIKEKPELTFKINSGMYILEPHLLNEIPDNEFFHITQLIENIKIGNGRIGVFPVSQNSWKDIGDWDLFLKENLINK